MTVDDDLAALLEGRPEVDQQEQAFPFLTVDEHGYPHVALLSRSEVDVTADHAEILVALRSRRTLANLERDAKATLIAVGGTVAHYAKLSGHRRLREDDGLVAWAFAVIEHKADSLGIPLHPVTFPTSDEVAQMERWDISDRALRRLASQR
jgi:hypothetical protein